MFSGKVAAYIAILAAIINLKLLVPIILGSFFILVSFPFRHLNQKKSIFYAFCHAEYNVFIIR
jgi:hypothetical protein